MKIVNPTLEPMIRNLSQDQDIEILGDLHPTNMTTTDAPLKIVLQ